MNKLTIYNKNHKKENINLPSGEYNAYITEVYVDENAATNYGSTDITTIKYDVLYGDKIYKVTQRLYYNDYQNSEFQKRISEFMEVFGLEDSVECSDLENKFVNIELSVKESSNGREYNKVEHILPYTGDVSDWDVAKGITPPSPKPQPKSAAEQFIFNDEEGGET